MEKSGVLTKGSIYRTFIKYVSFNIMSMIGLSCYILADTFFVANGVGSKGLIGLNIVLPVYSLMNGTGLMLGIGGATRFSIALGENNKQRGSEIFMHTLFLGVVASIFFTLAGVFFSEEIVTILGADKEILPYATDYLKTILSFSFAFLMNNIFVCFIRNDGDPRLSMLALLLASGSNIVFDYVFIYPFQMGMFGAALATGMAPVFSLCLISIHFLRKKNGFGYAKIHFKFGEAVHILLAGVSSFITELSSGIILLAFNIVILKIMGNIGVGAYGVIANIALVFLAIYNGIAQGIQPVVSINYGAGNSENIKKVFFCGCTLAAVLGIIFYTSGIFFSEGIIEAFNNEGNQQLASIADRGIHIYFAGLSFMGINVVTASFFACIEKSHLAMGISLFRGFVALFPVLIVLSMLLGMDGVWLTVPIVEFLTFLASAVCIRGYFTKKSKSSFV